MDSAFFAAINRLSCGNIPARRLTGRKAAEIARCAHIACLHLLYGVRAVPLRLNDLSDGPISRLIGKGLPEFCRRLAAEVRMDLAVDKGGRARHGKCLGPLEVLPAVA